MQTVDKALRLLDYFTPQRPEIGLSELARLAGYDKAAARRFLVALKRHDFIDQNPESKRYRLGAAFLHFARVREATLPLASIIEPVLRRLADDTGETSHGSLYSAGLLTNIGICVPNRATRVHVDPGEPLPLHATASGLAYLAFGPPERVAMAVERGLTPSTSHTITRKKDLKAKLADIAATGVSVSRNSFEDEVTGIAMPFFDGQGLAIGALAVASPSARMTPELQRRITTRLVAAVAEVTRGIGGAVPPAFLAAHGEAA